jgi:hypothetical protein
MSQQWNEKNGPRIPAITVEHIAPVRQWAPPFASVWNLTLLYDHCLKGRLLHLKLVQRCIMPRAHKAAQIKSHALGHHKRMPRSVGVKVQR